MQAGRLQVELTGGPAGGRHGEGLFDNGAPTAVTCGLRLNADRHAGRPDPGFLCVHEPGGRGWLATWWGLMAGQSVEVVPEAVGSGRVAQLGHRLGLDLADP